MSAQGGLTVGDAMTRDVITITTGTPVSEAVRLLDEYRISGVPVVDDDGRVVGVLSQTDLVRARASEHLWSRWPGLAARHLMTAPPICVKASLAIDEAAILMERARIHRVIVVGDDERVPVGILSLTDLVHVFARTARP